ncbi:HAD family hydrolase [Paenibacillus sp. YYML68]|uniref:HAD family hydrolase n=1 Tax=Paenibacillus sp. YYML68 TaxID=2909250 RepID=UPI00249207F3|nr:HAD family hydrolase [Paenibacillus sp. YYML68]
MIEMKPLRGKQAIFFDVNQTLVVQTMTFEACFLHAWEQLSARWLPEERPDGQELWQSYMTKWRQHKKDRITFKQLDELQVQCLWQVFREHRLPISEAMTRPFIQQVLQLHSSAKQLPPRTLETLSALASTHKLAVISNSPRLEVLQLLQRFGLQDLFPEHRVFTARSPAEKKPSLYLFKQAIRSMKLPPRQAVMVGNSWKHDVCGAVKAGMDAIWIHDSGSNEPDVKKISQHRLGRRNVYMIRRMEHMLELFV